MVATVRTGAQSAVDVGDVFIQVNGLLGHGAISLRTLTVHPAPACVTVLASIVIETIAWFDAPVVPIIRECHAEVEPSNERRIVPIDSVASRKEPRLWLPHGQGVRA